jgi:hypothetical protein
LVTSVPRTALTLPQRRANETVNATAVWKGMIGRKPTKTPTPMPRAVEWGVPFVRMIRRKL